jgi:hypothetical protein
MLLPMKTPRHRIAAGATILALGTLTTVAFASGEHRADDSTAARPVRAASTATAPPTPAAGVHQRRGRGTDDAAGDDRRGRGTDDAVADDRGAEDHARHGADDAGFDDHGRHGADDDGADDHGGGHGGRGRGRGGHDD